MDRVIAAHFDGKVIVPDEPVDLPAGQVLRVHIEVPDENDAPFADLTKFAGHLPGAPQDLAEQIDHYLYGTPKR